MTLVRSLIVLLSFALALAACGEATTPVDETGPAGTSAGPVAPTEGLTLHLARFFGECTDTTDGVTDVEQATNECEVIQILTNKFNAENAYGLTVEHLGGGEWGDYYPQLEATFEAGTPPDIAVMHQSRLADFSSRGLLSPVGTELDALGVDFRDYTAPALGAITFDGTLYGAAFDIHASLFHLNVDLFTEAGLVDADGIPLLPTSVEELQRHAAQLEEATGKTYFAHDWYEFGVGARLFLGFLAQHGRDVVGATGAAAVNTPDGRAALDAIHVLAEYSDPTLGYFDSQDAFLAGDVAILHNGTWVVDQYARETPFTYRVADVANLFGTPAAWGDSHLWVLPAQPDEDPGRRAAALEFIRFLDEHVGDWAEGTGHLATRSSVLSGAQLADAPHRDQYANTAKIAVMVPQVVGWSDAWDALVTELQATWMDGKDQQQALADAEARINEALGR